MALARSYWDELADSLEGSLLFPDDPGYAWARKRFVAHGDDLLPAAMARCASTEDVATALAFARSRGLPFALRSGGHSYADHSSTGGLLIDLARLNTITVDREAAVVGPGATTGSVAEHLARFGRVLPSGSWPTVGIGGIAVVGGYGFLTRKYGLTTDHLLAAQVVLADGTVTNADTTHAPDLYWALRGAGAGNFAAVTSLVLATRPLLPITSFYYRWPLSRAATVVNQWQSWAPDLPEEVSAELELIAPDVDTVLPTVELFGVSLLERATTAQVLHDFASAVGGRAERFRFETLHGLDAARYQVGLVSRDNEAVCIPDGPFLRPGFQFVKSEFFTQPLPVATIAALVEHLATNRSYGERRTLEFVPWRGAYSRVGPHHAAFVHREPRFLVKHAVLLGSRATPDRRAAARCWITGSWETTRPNGSGRAYQGFPDPDLADSGDAYYGSNLARLKKIKAAYDPEAVFVFSQSIPPY